jgi:esterase/lipase superfamily enzyme
MPCRAAKAYILATTATKRFALAISRWVWGSDARLGAIDPNVEPYKSRLAAEHANVFDLSDVKSPDSTNHSKFVNSPDLVRLVGNRLASGQALTDSHATVVDQFVATTANGVGSLETAVENAETPAEGAAEK